MHADSAERGVIYTGKHITTCVSTAFRLMQRGAFDSVGERRRFLLGEKNQLPFLLLHVMIILSFSVCVGIYLLLSSGVCECECFPCVCYTSTSRTIRGVIAARTRRQVLGTDPLSWAFRIICRILALLCLGAFRVGTRV